MSSQETVRPTGHLQVKGKRGNRAFYAFVRDAEGRRQRRLGPAWVKDSGKRTARGAVRWVARDGTKPDGHLTPTEAEDMLCDMLTAAPRRPAKRARSSTTAMTLREACDHWLRWAESDSEVKRSTLGDYGNVCDRICRDLGAQMRVSAITTERLEEWIECFQAERRISAAEARKLRAAGVEVRRLADGTPCSSRPPARAPSASTWSTSTG